MSASQTHCDGQLTVKNFKLLINSEPETTFVNGFFFFAGGSKGQKPHFPFWLGIVYIFKDSSRLVMAKGGPLAAIGITACF